ncbi:unnamed protein product, partial [Oppiella nova]
YDSIARDFGANGWSFEQLLPYFKKSENNTDPNVDPIYHGRSGPLGVSTPPNPEPLLLQWQQSLHEFGYPIIDVNGPTQYGTSITQSTIRDGIRQSTANSYLESNICPQLNIVTGALVTKVLIEGQPNGEQPKAVGVEFTKGNREYSVQATKETILSAGPFNTPQILMLSGIGHRDHLEKFEISPIWSDLPVGDNLQNHVILTISMPVRNSSLLLPGPQPNVQQLYDSIVSHTGAFATAPLSCLNFNSSVNSDWTYPDINLLVGIVPAYELGYENIFYLDKRPEEWRSYVDTVKKNANLAVAPVLFSPKSTGYIRLKSRDPKVYPMIQQNLLRHPDDMQAYLDAISHAFYLVEESSISEHVYVNPEPIPGCQYCPDIPVWKCSSYHKCLIQQIATPFLHPVGTCRMGAVDRDDVVVDERLRVKGVRNLRVIDSSVFPTVMNANTNAAAIVVGEKGAALVLEDYHQETHIKQLNDHFKYITFVMYYFATPGYDLGALMDYYTTNKSRQDGITATSYHPAGSCRMGSIDRPDVVVDPQLRVKNMMNLRVCDSSVFPTVPNSNTCAASITVGYKCAQFIKQYYKLE